MPITLYKFIFIEIIRLLVLSMLVLVGALAFAFTVPAIADGLLTPYQIILLVFNTMPIMLPYAAPVSACFATTLVFFRMASDNEITACIAGGISYRQLLTPVAFIGISMAVGMFVMSNWAIPYFSQRVTRLIEQDIVTLVIRKISQGQTVPIQDWTIYAESADDSLDIPQTPEGTPRPYRRLQLNGVALGKVDRKTGHLLSDYTAESVIIDLYDINDQTYATANLRGVVGHDPQSGNLMNIGAANLTNLKIDSPLKTKIDFYSLPDLKTMRDNPDQFPRVIERRHDLIKHSSTLRARQKILERFSGDGLRVLELQSLTQERITITTPLIKQEGEKIILEAEGNEKVVVEVMQAGLPRNRFIAESAELRVRELDLEDEPVISVTVFDLDVVDTSEGGRGVRTQKNEWDVGNMRLNDPISTPMIEMKSPALQASLSDLISTDEETSRLSERLAREIDALYDNIHHQIHARGAMAILCLIATMISAIVAILLRHSVPLAIFFWCFLPTIGCIFAISGSRNLIRGLELSQHFATGAVWAAPIAIILIGMLAYWKLRKN